MNISIYKNLKTLIIENNFNELNLFLEKYTDNQLLVCQMFSLSLQEKVYLKDNISVDSSNYLKEFKLGFKLYVLLEESKLPKEQFFCFKNAFFLLVEAIIEQIGIEIDQMKKSIDLNFEDDPNYYTYYEFREQLQELIDFFQKQNLLNDKVKLSTIKAKLSNFLDYEISKHLIGEDMLQVADSYLVLDMKENALKVYRAIIDDFKKGYSVSIFNGNLGKSGKTIVRPKSELAIYNNARIAIQKITGEEFPALKEQETIQFKDGKEKRKQKKTWWSKLKKMFR